jgi:hypothetical protein
MKLLNQWKHHYNNVLLKCHICHEHKQCIKIERVRKCQYCLTADDKKWLYNKKKEKSKIYKKTIETNKRTNYKPNTELIDMFKILANTRPHICFITGAKITGGIKPINCLHVLPKAKNQYPAWRLNPRNIVFAQSQCHVDEHSQPREVLESRPGKEGEGWRRYFKMQDEFKVEYKINEY